MCKEFFLLLQFCSLVFICLYAIKKKYNSFYTHLAFKIIKISISNEPKILKIVGWKKMLKILK